LPQFKAAIPEKEHKPIIKKKRPDIGSTAPNCSGKGLKK